MNQMIRTILVDHPVVLCSDSIILTLTTILEFTIDHVCLGGTCRIIR